MGPGDKLDKILQGFSENSINKMKIQYAMFNAAALEAYNNNMKKVNDDIESKISLYGMKKDECLDFINNITAKYDAEFQKIYDLRQKQFKHMLSEIGDIESNKSIALVNYLKIYNTRKNFKSSKDYLLYQSQRDSFATAIANASSEEERIKYTNLLNELADPTAEFNKKEQALLDKFNDYYDAVIEIENELDACIAAIEDDFASIVKIDNAMIEVKKENPVMKLINMILNKFIGKGKFAKEVVERYENQFKELEKDSNEVQQIINSQTASIIDAIKTIRNQINEQYQLSTQ